MSRKRMPGICLQKSTGLAYVRLSGEWITLGKWGSPEVQANYDRAIAEWLQRGRISIGRAAAREAAGKAEPKLPTVGAVLDAFEEHVKAYYRRPDGTPTNEVGTFALAFRPLRRLYGDLPASDFGPTRLEVYRDSLIKLGWSRGVINGSVKRVRYAFKWATSKELVPVAVFDALRTVEGLKRGRSEARETELVKPVPDEHIEAVIPYVAAPVAAMIHVQRLTGMRPGEVVAMRGRDLNMDGELWEYKPPLHKLSWRGVDRLILLGPRAREIVKPFLRSNLDEYLFQPAQAVAEHRKRRHAARRTPLSCGNKPGSRKPKTKPKRAPRDRYDTDAYRRAIAYGCRRAGIEPWAPNQIRHAAATEARRLAGIEGAQLLLGHARADVTQVYAEKNEKLLRELALRIG